MITTTAADPASEPTAVSDEPTTIPPGVIERERRRDEIEARIAELSGVINAAGAAMVEMVVESVVDADLWSGVGLRSPAHWLSWRAGVSTATARRVVDIAERVGELPALGQALREGAISLDAAALIARRVPVGFDEAAVELARNATIGQLATVVNRYAWPEDPADADGSAADHADDAEPAADPDPDADESGADASASSDSTPIEDPSRVSWWWDENQRFRLNATLSTDEGLALEAALAAAREDAWRLEHGDDDALAGLGSNASALGLLATGYLDHGAGHGRTADRYRIHAHLQIDPFGRNQLEAHLGPVLPRHLRRFLTCDADLVPVWEREGNPVAVGRSQRIVPDRLRRLIERRDGGCIVPGCPVRRGLHIHHLRHWEDGGGTDPNNLVAICARHHRLHHHGHLGIDGDPEQDGAGGLRVKDRFGRILTAAPITQPPPEPEPIQAARAADVPPGTFQPAYGEPQSVRDAYIPSNRSPSAAVHPAGP